MWWAWVAIGVAVAAVAVFVIVVLGTLGRTVQLRQAVKETEPRQEQAVRLQAKVTTVQDTVAQMQLRTQVTQERLAALKAGE